MNPVSNERTKLTATYVNGVAIAILAIGGFAPLISLASASDSAAPGVLVWIAVGCVLASFALHPIARLFLGCPQE